VDLVIILPVASLDEQAFGRAPEFGTTADMIYDDLPSNPEYLDASFGAAAGFRDMTDDDVEGFDEGDEPVTIPTAPDEPGVISSIGGETIRILDPQGIDPVEGYWETLAPDGVNST
jgi:autophagy-related protein 2